MTNEYISAIVLTFKTKTMKKLVVIVFAMFASFSISAQNRFETAAKETVAKMNEVVTLNEEQQKQIYDIELNVNTQKAAIRTENADNSTVIQEKTKELYADSNKKTKEIIGAEKFKIWVEYRKAQREKK
jgi:hypothetical protein